MREDMPLYGVGWWAFTFPKTLDIAQLECCKENRMSDEPLTHAPALQYTVEAKLVRRGLARASCRPAPPQSYAVRYDLQHAGRRLPRHGIDHGRAP